ncbi:conserved hypothetical protein [Neospora caninum Liverpool]|uniref:SPT2 chromatin n=1 Tax=Neospora caninum (strain Liverpool) TaxID=572307 RepID=F0VC43_NEOCL|nr:conserved hypothetical protein [Neospora caninum Liverpool]CBZ51177.1 conserved hypothetical protein [Neospora caninum Liverpool]CEL68488.1 TPA: hypothetical protein BN1204_042440 [Neospora caninum Liverpool]|eukprot:XP_003881210.1 conserved hypothetical protein [Neospora caninum Liverpool]
MDRLDELLLPEPNFLAGKPVTSPLESRLRSNRDTFFPRVDVSTEKQKREEARRRDAAEEKRRKEKAVEEEVLETWRADRKRELVLFLRRANRELLSGPEVNKAAAQFTALTENPGTVRPPEEVLRALIRDRFGEAPRSAPASGDRPRASDAPAAEEKRPAAEPAPAGPLTASQQLSIQLRERGAQLTRLRERERESRRQEEERVARERRRRGDGGLARRPRGASCAGARKASSSLRGVRDKAYAGSRPVPGAMSFEESRRKAQRHGVLVTKTFAKSACKPGNATPSEAGEDAESVGTGINGISKPVKRWVNGKVIVEKWGGISSLVYLPKKASRTNEEASLARSSPASASSPGPPTSASACHGASGSGSEAHALEGTERSLSVNQAVPSSKAERPSRPRVSPARGLGPVDRSCSASETLNTRSSHLRMCRYTSGESDETRPSRGAREKRSRSPGSSGRFPDAPGEQRQTKPALPRQSPLEGRVGLSSVPGSSRYSVVSSSRDKGQGTCSGRDPAFPPNAVQVPTPSSASGCSGVPKAKISHNCNGFASLPTSPGLSVTTQAARLGASTSRPRAFWAPTLQSGSKGSVSSGSTGSKTAVSAGKPRPRFVVPDLHGTSQSALPPKKYICGVPQPDRSVCTPAVGTSGAALCRTVAGAGTRPFISAASAVGSHKASRVEENALGFRAKPGGSAAVRSPWRAKKRVGMREDESHGEDGESEDEMEKGAGACTSLPPVTGFLNRLPSRSQGRHPTWRSVPSQEEDDDDMDDFIVDDEDLGDGADRDWQAEMRRVTGYDPRHFAGRFEGECAESGFHQQLQEERYSGQVAAQEDAEEYQKILDEAREERRLKKIRRDDYR